MTHTYEGLSLERVMTHTYEELFLCGHKYKGLSESVMTHTYEGLSHSLSQS